ncbi:MAG: pyridoxal phosphate-dependent aminotransferase [Pseudomonadota bacterium]
MRGSQRIASLNDGGNDGWGLFYRARQMLADGEQVIELTIGEHDIQTDPRILDAMDRSARAGALGYAPVPGFDSLRDAVAARVSSATGVPTARDNIAITPGGQAGLFAAHMAACDPGDAALLIDPYYATYPGTLRGAGTRPIAVAARPEDGFQPRATDIDTAAAANDARSLLINTPNNPTGAVYAAETLERLAEVIVARDMWLISDEVYDVQVWDGAHLSPRVLPGMAERTLVIGSLSKSHAMTGSRLGWIVGPADLVARIHDLATVTTYGVAGFVQEAGLFALSLGPAFEAEVAAPFRRRRDALLSRLARQNVLHASAPAGAMFVMLDVRATGLSGAEFAENLLAEERIAVMPGDSFGHAASGHVRVALTQPDAVFGDACDRLIAFAGRCAMDVSRAS